MHYRAACSVCMSRWHQHLNIRLRSAGGNDNFERMHTGRYCWAFRPRLQSVLRTFNLLLLVTWCCSNSPAGAAASSSASDAELLQECLNTNYSFHPANWNQLLFDQRSSSLKVERVWWSTRPPVVDVTMTTQLSMSRLTTFARLCGTWRGPVSAAVYVPLVQAGGKRLNMRNAAFMQQNIMTLDEIFNRLDANGTCQLQVMLLWEVFETYESSLLYPVNILRNYALLQAKTSLVFSNDVDLLVSHTLLEDLKIPNGVLPQMRFHCETHRHAFIIPAFEVSGSVPDRWKMEVAVEAAQGSKERLTRLKDLKQVEQFHVSVPLAHGQTNYARVFTSPMPYAVQFMWGFEPWIIASRRNIPFWDVRFRGYGANKAIHGLHMAQMNFTHLVWPYGWLVHIPHHMSTGRNMFVKKWTFQNDPESSLFKIVTQLTHSVLGAGTAYRPVVDDITTECMKKLPWWHPGGKNISATKAYVSQSAYAAEVHARRSSGVTALAALEPELAGRQRTVIPQGTPVGPRV